MKISFDIDCPDLECAELLADLLREFENQENAINELKKSSELVDSEGWAKRKTAIMLAHSLRIHLNSEIRKYSSNQF